MTRDDALGLRVGDYVCHPARVDYLPDGRPVKPPIRVTEVWVNVKHTIILVRLASVARDEWLDATGYELPPEGKVYDRTDREWMTPAEQAARKASRSKRYDDARA